MKILLAEDDAFFQNFYSKKLTESNCVVDVARDGEEAISKILASRPDLLLLDLIMPKKDGFDVLKEISLHEELKGMPVIVFSTLSQEQDVKKALSLGAADYVNKTFFDFDKLLAKIYAAAKTS